MSNEPNENDTYPYQQGKRIDQVEYSASITTVIFLIISGMIIGAGIVSIANDIYRWATGQ